MEEEDDLDGNSASVQYSLLVAAIGVFVVVVRVVDRVLEAVDVGMLRVVVMVVAMLVAAVVYVLHRRRQSSYTKAAVDVSRGNKGAVGAGGGVGDKPIVTASGNTVQSVGLGEGLVPGNTHGLIADDDRRQELSLSRIDLHSSTNSIRMASPSPGRGTTRVEQPLPPAIRP
jgi:hypothetical protein